MSSSRAPALGAVVLLHLALLAWWMHARPSVPRLPASGPELQWRWIFPPAKIKPPPPEPEPVRTTITATTRTAPRPTIPSPSATPPARPVDTPAPTTPVPPDEPVIVLQDADPFAAPPQKPAEKPDLVAQAKGAVGKIDRDLQRERANLIRAPISTPESRLIAGIQAAAVHHGVAPEITEIGHGAQGPESVRMYRVRGPLGTYCLRIASNPGAFGIAADRPKTMRVTCPK